ncbi:MAG: DUF1697 domain-containing protein [Clostridiaceae bacterium]|nr:DUF1697 domain-containing protein [Clostridiaceae bacterium]
MVYAVLFRGINVGGKNAVKMNDLKQVLLDLNLHKVKTYIQSGNAVFESDLDEASLQEEICGSFLKQFGFSCKIIIRNIDEIHALIQQLPFTPDEISSAEEADPDVEHLYAYFLDDTPQQVQIDAICQELDGQDILGTGKRELYLLCRGSIRKSKTAAKISKLFDSSTSRNWSTVCHLYDMMYNL